MSLLINNELIWISIPRCASTSIEKAFLTSNLDIKKHSDVDKGINNKIIDNPHIHIRKKALYDEFGIKDTISIKRDWFERWVSGLNFLFNATQNTHNVEMIIKWEELTNEFLYKQFDDKFLNGIYKSFLDENDNWEGAKKAYASLIKNKDELTYWGSICVLLSENHWKENEPATYEFDISELDLFNDFIFNKYGERLTIQRQNFSSSNKSKLVFDNTFKNWVWDKFEKRYEKNKRLI